MLFRSEDSTNSGEDTGITEGEEPVEENTHENENNNPGEGETGTPEGGETGTEPAPEDEYDPNIGEQFQEGEVLIEDAAGNTVNEFNDGVLEGSAAENTVVVEQPAAAENTVVVEQPAAAVTETAEEAAPAPVEQPAAEQTTSTEFTEDQIAALVEEVYQNTLIQEGEEELEQTSGKRR